MAGISMSRRKIAKILRNNGFRYVRSSGGHDIYKRGGRTAVINVHPNELIIQNYIRTYDLKY